MKKGRRGLLELSLWVFMSLFNSQLLASDKPPRGLIHSRCDWSLTDSGKLVLPDKHEYLIVPSAPGRDDEQAARYQEFVDKMTAQGGVLDQLGIPRTKQVVEFMPGPELNAMLGATAAQPAPHYYDGARILQGMTHPQGYVYEVVFPGPDFNHGYYRDDSKFNEQLSILAHVVGHNHFALTSRFPHYRVAQATLAGIALANGVRDAYGVAPKAEVEEFFMHIQSLGGLSDFYTALYESPSEFSLDQRGGSSPHQGDEEGALKQSALLRRGLKAPTENVLQAFSARVLDSGAPEWKKRILKLLPDVGAYRPAMVHTQILNEGWASLMQEIVMDHMGPEYNTITHWLDAQHVTRWTPHHLFQDPYWFGVRLWRDLRRKFEERSQIRALSTQLEKDRAFIRYAEEEIISKMDDRQFLDLAFDDALIQKWGLALTREATAEEARQMREEGKLPPPPGDLPHPAPVIVTSRDPQRIRKAIKQQIIDSKTRYSPRVRLESFNRQETGQVELIIDDPVGFNLSLEKKTLAPALYALANVVAQPISLEATLEYESSELEHLEEWEAWELDNPVIDNPFGDFYYHTAFQLQPLLPGFSSSGSSSVMVKGRYRLVVSPRGEIELFFLEKLAWQNHLPDVWSPYSGAPPPWVPAQKDESLTNPPQEEPLPKDHALTRTLREALDKHLEELHIDNEHRYDEILEANPNLQAMAIHTVTQITDAMPISTLVSHVPFAADAIAEYHGKVASRIAKVLLKAMEEGGGGLRRTSSGLFLKALPSEVSIEFDREALKALAEGATPDGVDSHMIMHSNPFDGDLGTGGVAGPTDKGPGQGGWTSKPPPGDGGQVGPEPGEDPADPTWIPIPEELYARFLGERVKLPNLKPKGGLIRSKKYRLKGRQLRRRGALIVDQTAANALKKGLGLLEDEALESSESGSPLEVDPFEALERGYGLMRDTDFVVKKPKAVKKPDVNAVVVFARDASGSTHAYTPLYKDFVHDMAVLLRANYKNLIIRYIIFDTEAHMMKDEQAFFQTELWGGTSYKVAAEATLDLLEDQYPAAKFDRFAFTVGDLGDWYNPATEQAFMDLVEATSFSGVVKGGYGMEDFEKAMVRLSDEQEFFGYVDLGVDPQGYGIEHIRRLLKNPEE